MNLLYNIWGIRKLILVLENLIFNLLYQKRLSNKVNIFGFPIISIAKSSQINIGRNSTIISHCYFSEPGINHPAIIRTLNEGAKIKIGDDVGISGGGICAAEEVIIGNKVMLGANVFITDTDFHPLSHVNRRYNSKNILAKKVIIKDNVFIGMNSLVLKGAIIGTNSIIGANSVVTTNIPDNAIAAGIPAEIIRFI